MKRSSCGCVGFDYQNMSQKLGIQGIFQEDNWNTLIANRSECMKKWERMKKSENALERVHGKQMIELTAEGPLEFEIPELTRMVLEEIIVRDKKTFTVKLLDGTEQNISL